MVFISVLSAEPFGGLGLVIAQLFDQSTSSKAGETVVLGVLAGSDAGARGIRPGDVIVTADGRATKGESFDTLVYNSFRGKVGSTAELTIRRTGVDSLMTFKVKRSEITPPPEEKTSRGRK